MAEEESSAGRSRRDLLKKVGVGGALVWAAPVVDAVAAPPAYAASSGCTIANFSATETSVFVGAEPVRRLQFGFDLSGCPAVAGFTLVLSSQPPIPAWDTPGGGGFLSSGTTGLSFDSPCADDPFDTTVSYTLRFFDASGTNELGSFSGTVFSPSCV